MRKAQLLSAAPELVPHEQLVNCFPFLSTEEISTFRDSGVARVFRRGAILSSQDFPQGQVHVIYQGRAECFKRKGMKVLTLGTVEAGDMVGDVAALLALPSPVTVRAVEVTRVLSIETQKFRELIDSLAGLRDMLLKKLSRNILFLESRLMCLLSDSVPMRLLQALQDLEELPGSEPPCRIIPSHVALARVVGTSREVVTRSLKLLVQEGRILVVGKRVFLTPGSKAGVAQNG